MCIFLTVKACTYARNFRNMNQMIMDPACERVHHRGCNIGPILNTVILKIKSPISVLYFWLNVQIFWNFDYLVTKCYTSLKNVQVGVYPQIFRTVLQYFGVNGSLRIQET